MANIRPAELPDISSFKPESLRGGAGLFRVGQTHLGQWWLLDPHDRPVFMKAVAAVNRHGRAGPPPRLPGAHAQAAGGEASPAFARRAAARLRDWNVNTLGPWADDALARDGGFYETVLAGFVEAGAPVIHARGTRLPDVFDPGWPAACDARAAQLAAGIDGARRNGLIGWHTDEALGWGEPRPERPGLLQVCLSLEPAHAAYHAAWEFVLAPHAGLAELGRAWSLDLPNKEALRQSTLADRALATPAFLRDHERFTREFARRYFAGTSSALRRHDPGRLILGCRFAGPPGEPVLAECVYPQVDAVSWHCHAPDFALHAGRHACAAGMPLLLVAAGLGNERFRAASFNLRAGPTRVERMLSEGRRALTGACRHPAVIGYEWARWVDEPGAVPPFGAGLVHVDGGEAAEHADLLAQINARAERLRRRAARAR